MQMPRSNLSSHRRRPVPMRKIDPGLRGCQEIDDYFDRRCESFETAASRPPQDEDSSLMPSITYLMLRSARGARLEARTTLLQLFFLSAAGFPDSLIRGYDE